MAGASGSRAAAAPPPVPTVVSDEVNVLIYTYLLDSGFSHAAYSLRNEARLDSVPIFRKFNPDPRSEEFASSAASHPHSAANPSAYANSAPNGSSATSKSRKGKGKDTSELGTTIPPPGDGAATPGLSAEDDQRPKIRRGQLVEYLAKGLMYKEVETHCKMDGSRVECRQPMTLIRPHVCSVQAAPLPTFMLDDLPLEDDVLPPARSSIFPPPPLRVETSDTRSRARSSRSRGTVDEDVDMEAGKSDTEAISIKKKGKDGLSKVDEGPMDAPSPGASSSTSRSGKASKNGRVRMAEQTDEEEAVPKKRKRNGSEAETSAAEASTSSKGKAAQKGAARRETPESEDGKPGNRSRRNSNASSSVKMSEKEMSPPKIKNPLLPVKQEAGVVSWRWKGQSKQIVHVVWNPANLNRLASCSTDGTALIWDFEETSGDGDQHLVKLASPPSLCSHKSVEKPKPVIDIAYSPDGNLLATACADGIARVFLEDGSIQNVNTRHAGELYTLAFSESNNHLATAGADGSINVWVASNPGSRLKMSVTPHTQEIFHVDFLDGDVFASGSADHTVAVGRVSTPQSYKLLKAHSDRVMMVKFAPKTGPEGTPRLLASASEDKTICIWDVEAIVGALDDPSKGGDDKSFLVRKIDGQADDVVLLQWHPEGVGKDGRRLLLSASRADEHSEKPEHTINMFDVKTGKCLFTSTEHTDVINSIEFSPKGSVFASCSDDHSVIICETETGKIIKRFDLDAGVNDLRFRQDGKQLALALQNRSVLTVFVGDLVKE